MSPIERIAQAVRDAQREGHARGDIASALVSFAAGYPLEIGWSAELVAETQQRALELHSGRFLVRRDHAGEVVAAIHEDRRGDDEQRGQDAEDDYVSHVSSVRAKGND